MKTEVAFHNIDGLETRKQHGWQDAWHDTRQQDKDETYAHTRHVDIFTYSNLALKQLANLFLKTDSQEQTNHKRDGNHQGRLCNQLERHTRLTTAEKLSGSYLLGTEAGISNRQIDIIANSEEEKRKYSG